MEIQGPDTQKHLSPTYLSAVHVTAVKTTYFIRVYTQMKKCEENKYPSPKLTAANLHPGICKQNVAKALAIFEPSTIAVDRMYFPESRDAAGFLHQARTRGSIAMTDSEMQQN